MPSLGTDRWLLAAGALVALTATAGSLLLSEVWGLAPCDLCWYQRILMYPLVAVFGVALYEHRPGAYRTAFALTVPGALVAGYHSWLQIFGDACTLGGGCVAVQYRLEPLGLTVPNLALLAFLLIAGIAAGLGTTAR
ncbi:MAG: disulfide bond formation protein B [Haloarculaceae archaeon]